MWTALLLPRVGRFFAAIPTQVYLALGGGLAVILGTVWYHHAINAAEKRGEAKEAAKIEAKALALKAATDALTTNVATLIRTTNDAENNRIRGDAGRVLLL